jgi:4-alpha-glucanotransferase
MCVLQFAFEDNDANNLYLPHNVNANSVFYTGTHDNDTTWGWYRSVSKEVKHRVRQYLGVSGDDIAWDFVRASYATVSRIAVIPMQDLLNLGTNSRLNSPGRTFGNWQWRYTREALSNIQQSSTSHLKELGAIYGRIQAPPSIPKKKIPN